MRQLIRIANLAIRTNYIPKYTILQNVSRLKATPKVLEIPMYHNQQELKSPFIEKDLFISESLQMLQKIEKQFDELKSYEDRVQDSTCIYDGDIQILNISIKDFGAYNFTTSPKERVLYFQSPLSGVSKYYYDTENQAWTSNKDKHLLIELLVRETSKYLRGYLNF